MTNWISRRIQFPFRFVGIFSGSRRFVRSFSGMRSACPRSRQLAPSIRMTTACRPSCASEFERKLSGLAKMRHPCQLCTRQGYRSCLGTRPPRLNLHATGSVRKRFDGRGMDFGRTASSAPGQKRAPPQNRPSGGVRHSLFVCCPQRRSGDIPISGGATGSSPG